MSGKGSRGLGRGSKGSKGIAKRGGRSRSTTTTTTMRTSASAPVAIPPLATGRGRLGRPPAESHATQPQQQRVAGIFLPPPGRSRPIEEKDADSVVELMVDEQATNSSGTDSSTPATTPVRRISSSRRRPSIAEEEFSSPAPGGNTSSLSLSTFFTPNTARVLSAVVADFEEGEEEMLIGTLGEDALDSQTVVTVKQPRQAAEEEEEFVGSSQQDLFEEGEDDDDRVEDRDWVAAPGDVISSEEEEDASAGLARRISIADIAIGARSGRGMRDPQSASLASSATTTVSRTTLKPPPITTGRPVAVPAVAAPSGRKGMFTSPIWQFFTLPSVECKYATCNHCRVQLSRGADPSKYGTSSLVTHLAGKHFHEHEEFMKLKAACAGSGKPTTAQPSAAAAAAAATRPPPAAAPAGVRKRTAPPPSATPAADTEDCSGSQSSVASSAPSVDSRASKKGRQTLLSESFQGVVRVLPPSSRRVRQLNGLLARAMCSQLLPYSLVQEGSDMRALLMCAAPDWRIPSRHFFSRTAIPALHRSVMANVGRGLDHAVGERVHVTMDSWSSRFGTGRYLSFTAHWVALVEGGESGTAAAATQWVVPPRRVRGIAAGSSDPLPPSGKPAQTPRLSSSVKPRHCQALLELVSLGKTKLTAPHVLAKLQEQERSWLTPRGLRVGEVVADNGANLVAAIRRGDLTHIPCLAHVLNLVVQKFLRTYQGMDQLLDAARDVVRHFRRSAAAAAGLEEVQKELHLPQHRLILDVPTRWNSTLAMLERLVEQRQAVNQYIGQATVASITATGRAASNLPSIISTEDWGHMRQVCSVLAPFLQATNMVSRDHAMVCEWVPLVCLLDRALFALLEEGEAALEQQELQAAAQASSEEEEEALELVEVPDLAADEGEQHSAAELVRGWREDEVQEAVGEEDSTVSSGAAELPAHVARLFPMAAHMLRCLRRDPRVIQMRDMEDIWISMMLDPRLKGKLTQFLPPARGDRAQQMRALQRSLVERLEKAFPQLSTPTVQPAEKQQQVPAAATSKRTKDLLSLSHELYRCVELPDTRAEVPAATSSSTHTQRLTRMVADYMGSFSGLDSDAPVDPMEYWVKRLEIWSELAQYALEVLSCPPSSVLSERCFSAAGGVVTEKRSRLSHKSVDRLTFLKMNQAWVEGDFLAPVVGERGT